MLPLTTFFFGQQSSLFILSDHLEWSDIWSRSININFLLGVDDLDHSFDLDLWSFEKISDLLQLWWESICAVLDCLRPRERACVLWKRGELISLGTLLVPFGCGDIGCPTGNGKSAEWAALGCTALFHVLCNILHPHTVEGANHHLNCYRKSHST